MGTYLNGQTNQKKKIFFFLWGVTENEDLNFRKDVRKKKSNIHYTGAMAIYFQYTKNYQYVTIFILFDNTICTMVHNTNKNFFFSFSQ